MAVERIDCATDPRLALYRHVRDGDLLRERGLFVAEARLIVKRAIEDRRYVVRSLLVNDAALRDLAPALDRLEASVPVLVCRTDDFLQVTGFHIHRGCLALVERPVATPVDHLIYRAQALVVLEAVANADNVGGVFRNAAAFGADGVLLSPTCCDPLYRKAIRTSMGAVLSVAFARVDEADWPGVLTRVRAAGATIVALTPREPSEALDDFAARWGRAGVRLGSDPGPTPARPRIALVVGAEGGGLSPAVEAAADYRVRIPISDRVDSLNLAVAAGIALHRLRSG
jgi:tRNA G18 (ribose-2'-O)-methylase SpoU